MDKETLSIKLHSEGQTEYNGIKTCFKIYDSVVSFLSTTWDWLPFRIRAVMKKWNLLVSAGKKTPGLMFLCWAGILEKKEESTDETFHCMTEVWAHALSPFLPSMTEKIFGKWVN
jgi:hypothetical protein